MPNMQAAKEKGGELVINDGVTRATRANIVKPDEPVTVEVMEAKPLRDLSGLPGVKDR